MPPFAVLSVLAVSASQCLAIARGHVDQTSFLQAELERVRVQGDGSDLEPECPVEPIHKQLAGKGGSCERLTPQPIDVLASGPKAEPQALPVEPQLQAEEPPVQSTRSAGSHCLGYILDVLVVALVIDGLRRWRQGRAEEASDSGSWECLMKAVAAGDVARSEALLREEDNINGSDLWGCTLLHAASKGGAVPIVRQLLERGAEAEKADSWDETPLHLAARAGHAAVCELLLAHGVAVDAANAQGWTPLVVAADAGHRAVCSFLVEQGASAGDLSDAALPTLLASVLAEYQVQDSFLSEEAAEEAAEYKRIVEEEYWQREAACEGDS